LDNIGRGSNGGSGSSSNGGGSFFVGNESESFQVPPEKKD
jgi:hypothetical protein